MDVRVDTADWYGDAVVVGNVGLGVLGSAIPATGRDGPSFIYPCLSLPDDANKQIRARITRWPTGGTITINEDGSFVWVGGNSSFDFVLSVDGVEQSPQRTVYLGSGVPPEVSGATLGRTASSPTGTQAHHGAVSGAAIPLAASTVTSGTPEPAVAGASMTLAASSPAGTQAHFGAVAGAGLTLSASAAGELPAAPAGPVLGGRRPRRLNRAPVDVQRPVNEGEIAEVMAILIATGVI